MARMPAKNVSSSFRGLSWNVGSAQFGSVCVAQGIGSDNSCQGKSLLLASIQKEDFIIILLYSTLIRLSTNIE